MKTIEDVAAMLTDREYLSEISRDEEAGIKALGFVVIFGASDDLIEFRGAINDEIEAYDGTSFRLTTAGLVEDHECDCQYCSFDKDDGAEVKAQWCEVDGYSWTFETELRHATFEIVEDGEPYCRGIVIDLKEIR